MCTYTYIYVGDHCYAQLPHSTTTTDAELNDSDTDNGEKVISLLQSFVVEVCTIPCQHMHVIFLLNSKCMYT